MSSDIDRILSAMFGADDEGKSKMAQEAEAFLESVNKSSEKLNSEIKNQFDSIEAISRDAQKDMDEIKSNLEKDNLMETELESKNAPTETQAKFNYNSGFLKATQSVKEEIIGQDEFLKKLFLGFKRPFVMGIEKDKPASSIIISGKNGTGRHCTLEKVVSSLCDEKVLDNKEIFTIDLSLYSSNSDNKLIIQDLYASLHSKAKVVVFENYHKCHASFLAMISDLVVDGKIGLPTRYVSQKGILVEAGTALVAGAVSSIACDGQYLVFITEDKQSKIADIMGSEFIEGVGDICTTGEFTRESLEKIGNKELSYLCDKAKNILNFQIAYTEEVAEYFADKFTKDQGVDAIVNFSGQCYKVLSEYKLNQDIEDADVLQDWYMSIDDNVLEMKIGNDVLYTNQISSSTALEAVKEEIDKIVGLSEIKEYIFSLEEHYKVSQMRKERGLKSDSTSMHMIFSGNPGTGKTTIARLVSRYLKAIGILSNGQLVEVTRADLVGRYVGHTAPLTNHVIKSALGGVLFIDEAYSLFRGKDDTFGLEAIDTLVKGMEDNRDNLVVILAGYTKEMEIFLTANSGLSSRFPNIIEFPDYTPKELLDISKIIVKSKGYYIGDDCDDEFLKYFEEKQKSNPSNGRVARNLIESGILNQSKRIIAENTDNLEELKLEDFDLI